MSWINSKNYFELIGKIKNSHKNGIISDMRTYHKIFFQPAQNLKKIENDSVAIVVTSPPYPMIEIWDEIFSEQNSEIRIALEMGEGNKAFNLMHELLNTVWDELFRILIPGGIVCVNIGDATRTINNIFQIFTSHAKIINHFHKIGFQSLPEILWRKQTNSPNKFMGSGMLPPNAYVTYEHEYILIFRKGGKREFKKKEENLIRRESSYFWEERNIWFSDVWDFKGTGQNMKKKSKETRARSAAFPFELAYRLINMFSIRGDIVFDPFLGTGTTVVAAMTSGRSSIGIEINEGFRYVIVDKIKNKNTIKDLNEYISNRIKVHSDFVNVRRKEKEIKYMNEFHQVPVVTNQEKNLKIHLIKEIAQVSDSEFEVDYLEKINPNLINNRKQALK